MPLSCSACCSPSGITPRSSPTMTAPGARRLHPGHRQHGIAGHRHIGARQIAIGHPVGALEAEDMIDAQRAGKAQLLAQGGGQRLEAGVDQVHRVERREVPVLALRREGVGRRAEAGAEGKALAVFPGLGAMRVSAHGKVEIEPELEPRGLRRRWVSESAPSALYCSQA